MGPAGNECRLALEETQLRDRVEKLEEILAEGVNLISGVYRSTWGDSALITNLGGRRYKFEAWQGSGSHPPDKSLWYNIGEGNLLEDGRTIYVKHEDQKEYAGANNITESYWEIIDERHLKQTTYRVYRKDNPPSDPKWGWGDGPTWELAPKKK